MAVSKTTANVTDVVKFSSVVILYSNIIFGHFTIKLCIWHSTTSSVELAVFYSCTLRQFSVTSGCLLQLFIISFIHLVTYDLLLLPTFSSSSGSYMQIREVNNTCPYRSHEISCLKKNGCKSIIH